MKKRTGKLISLSLAVAMAMTAAPVTALADTEPTTTDVIEAPALTPTVETGKTERSDTKKAVTDLKPAKKVQEGVNTLPAEEAEILKKTTETLSYGENEIINIRSSEELVAAIQNQKDGQTWILEAGNYDVVNTAEDSNGSYDANINGETGFAFPITANNLTIKAAEGAEGEVTITSSYRPDDVQGGVWHNQNFITVAGEGVTIEGVNLKGNPNDYYGGQCNKVIETVAKDFTLKKAELLPIEDEDGKVSSGSIYINVADSGTTTIEDVTLYSWINAKTATTGNVNASNVTIDFTNNTYAGYSSQDYGFAWNPAVSGNSDNIELTNFTVKVDAETNLQEQIFTDQLKEGTVVELCGKFEEPIGITKSQANVPVILKGGEDNDISAMTIMNADNITLDGLNFTNASTKNNLDVNPSALYVQNANNITVDNCTFDGSSLGDTIAVAIATAAGTEDLTVENSTIKDFVMSGYHNTGTDITYDNNKFENIQSGVAFDGTNGVTVIENTFDNANGIRLRPYGTTKCENVTVTENSFNSVNTASPYGQYAVVTTTLDGDGKPVAGGDGVDNVDLSGNYWGGANSVEAIKGMVISNESQSVSIDTFYKTPEDKENGSETVVTTETGIKVNGVWYKTTEDLKNLIKNGIPAGTTVEVYGKVNIPFSTGISKENGSIVEGYFVVDTDNVTIKGMTEDATLYTSEIHPNGTWGSQSFMLITGDNVTLEGLTIMPQATTNDGETNKTIEFAGNTLNMHNCTVKPNETTSTKDGGSLYFNGDKDTVLVEDCIFDKVSICFDSVDSAESILIQKNTFTNPGDPYTIGNTTWSTPPATSMADITVKENVFQGLSDDTVLVRQKMEGNFVLEENTTDNGSSIADMVEFVTSDSLSKDKMHVTVTENGQTVVLTPNEDGSPEVGKTFKLNATSLSTKVGRSVTLTAYLDDAKIAADWAVDGVEKATNRETFEFTPNAKGTYTITASYEADGITYVATCEVTAKSSSSGSSHSYDGYITIINPKNGEVSVSDDWAYEDDKITLTVTPDKGYEVDKIEIVDDEGDKITAKKVEDEDNKYTFRMANCDVTITVTFKEEGKTTTDDKEDTENKEDETTKLNFTDVSSSDWFFKGVEYVVDKGVMSGVSENQFDPNGKLTRAMLVQMLYNMESRPTCNAENAFIDVPVGQWYTDAVIWANDAKIVSGMGDSLFAPNMEITREQMVVMLYNYAKYKGYDVTASASLSTFTDSTSVSAWAQPAMQWAVAEGYISGMGNSQIAPQGTATRAEIASVIMRFMEATAASAETAE